MNEGPPSDVLSHSAESAISGPFCCRTTVATDVSQHPSREALRWRAHPRASRGWRSSAPTANWAATLRSPPRDPRRPISIQQMIGLVYRRASASSPAGIKARNSKPPGQEARTHVSLANQTRFDSSPAGSTSAHRVRSQRTESAAHSPERTSGCTNISSCPPIAVGQSPDNWLKSCTMCI